MKWAFTFGQGYDLHDKYILIDADTEEEARLEFIRQRRHVGGDVADNTGLRWAFTYPVNDDWAVQVERFRLSEVPIDTPINWRDSHNPHH